MGVAILVDCEQPLFSSKIRGEERKTSERDVRAARYHARTLTTRLGLTCVVFLFAFFLTDFRAKERLLAIYCFRLVVDDDMYCNCSHNRMKRETME